MQKGKTLKNPNFKQTKNEIKKAIREYLELNGYEVYRINNGGSFRGFNKDGGKRFSFSGTPGVADMYAIKKGDYPLWIEAKATGKKPTEEQYKFCNRVNESFGSFWIWADSLDIFIEKHNNIKRISPQREGL